MENLYTRIETVDRRHRFIYLTVFFVIFGLFSQLKIGLNLFAAGICTVGVVFYLERRRETKIAEEGSHHREKIERIRPTLKAAERYPELVDFLFTIQEFYSRHPPAYEEMVTAIDQMMMVYEESKLVTRNCEHRYQVAETQMKQAVNALHSIIFSLGAEKELQEKLTRAHRRLLVLLKRYLREIYDRCQMLMKKDGYHTQTKPIDFDGPKPYNTYLKRSGFTYEYY